MFNNKSKNKIEKFLFQFKNFRIKASPRQINSFSHRRAAFQIAAFSALLVLSLFYLMPAAETVFLVQNDAAKRKLPIYCVETEEKKVAVSFDAAWGADDTQTLLDILAKNDVKTTFFLCGYWIDKYPEQVKAIYAAGHDIGNHGNTHAHGTRLNLEENKKEILAVHEKIYNLLGTEINLFRPPFGEYNDTVLTAAAALGYHSVQWDVDSLDWKEFGTNQEIKQVLEHKHLGGGSIILFHNDAKYTPEALGPIIKGIKKLGYQIVPVSELIYTENYSIDSEGRQKRLSPLLPPS